MVDLTNPDVVARLNRYFQDPAKNYYDLKNSEKRYIKSLEYKQAPKLVDGQNMSYANMSVETPQRLQELKAKQSLEKPQRLQELKQIQAQQSLETPQRLQELKNQELNKNIQINFNTDKYRDQDTSLTNQERKAQGSVNVKSEKNIQAIDENLISTKLIKATEKGVRAIERIAPIVKPVTKTYVSPNAPGLVDYVSDKFIDKIAKEGIGVQDVIDSGIAKTNAGVDYLVVKAFNRLLSQQNFTKEEQEQILEHTYDKTQKLSKNYEDKVKAFNNRYGDKISDEQAQEYNRELFRLREEGKEVDKQIDFYNGLKPKLDIQNKLPFVGSIVLAALGTIANLPLGTIKFAEGIATRPLGTLVDSAGYLTQTSVRAVALDPTAIGELAGLYLGGKLAKSVIERVSPTEITITKSKVPTEVRNLAVEIGEVKKIGEIELANGQKANLYQIETNGYAEILNKETGELIEKVNGEGSYVSVVAQTPQEAIAIYSKGLERITGKGAKRVYKDGRLTIKSQIIESDSFSLIKLREDLSSEGKQVSSGRSITKSKELASVSSKLESGKIINRVTKESKPLRSETRSSSLMVETSKPVDVVVAEFKDLTGRTGKVTREGTMNVVSSKTQSNITPENFRVRGYKKARDAATTKLANKEVIKDRGLLDLTNKELKKLKSPDSLIKVRKSIKDYSSLEKEPKIQTTKLANGKTKLEIIERKPSLRTRSTGTTFGASKEFVLKENINKLGGGEVIKKPTGSFKKETSKGTTMQEFKENINNLKKPSNAILEEAAKIEAKKGFESAVNLRAVNKFKTTKTTSGLANTSVPKIVSGVGRASGSFSGKGTYERTEDISFNRIQTSSKNLEAVKRSSTFNTKPKTLEANKSKFNNTNKFKELTITETRSDLGTSNIESLKQPIKFKERQLEGLKQKQESKLQLQTASPQISRPRNIERSFTKIKTTTPREIKIRISKDESKQKKILSPSRSSGGFAPVVKEKGKFFRLGTKIFKTKEEALGTGFGKVFNDLNRSVSVIKVNRGNAVSDRGAATTFSRLVSKFRASKQYGSRVLVQKNALSNKRETTLIQEARNRANSGFKKIETRGRPSIRSIK